MRGAHRHLVPTLASSVHGARPTASLTRPRPPHPPPPLLQGRVRSLSQRPLEVWQVTLARLRCWTSPGDPGSPPGSGAAAAAAGAPKVVRPVAALVACIYPDEGRLLGYAVDPRQPAASPGPARLLATLTDLMRDPPFGTQRRPGKVLHPHPPPPLFL